MSDRIGRKRVLLLGCFGTVASLLIVGFASNFWVALVGRLLGGMLNGNVGVIQTMVAETVKNPAHEPKAYAIMPAVWSIGTIVGPAIGGCFSDPAKNFSSVFSRTGMFGVFPYLLPNVMCAALMLVSIVACYVWVHETHPDMQPWSTSEELENTDVETPLIPTTTTTTTPAANLATESYGTFNPVQITEEEIQTRDPSFSPASSQKAFSKPVMVLIVSLGLFTYHAMTYDTLIPVYLQDDVDASNTFGGGLGLGMQQVGTIMSVNGMIALFIQAVVFPLLANNMGVWPLFVVVAVGFPIAYVIVPSLQLLPAGWVYVGIYTFLTIRNFFSIIFYPLILILLKEAAPSSSCLGKINGLAASTGGACRMVASPMGGMMYGLGLKLGFSSLVWWSSAFVALIGALQVPFIKRQKNKKAHVGSAVSWTSQDNEDGTSNKTRMRVEIEEITSEDEG